LQRERKLKELNEEAQQLLLLLGVENYKEKIRTLPH